MYKLLFFTSLTIIFYIYFGYPVTIYLISRFRKTRDISNQYFPEVTVIIAARNEELCIEETIKNKIELNYPKDKLEIIVVSDESTDRTDAIVKNFNSDNVTFYRQIPRAGKTSALNMAVPKAKGEIIVFSDANSIYDKDALIKLTRNFLDINIGYVTGKMVYTDLTGSIIGDGCSTYMKYENLLHKYETMSGSVVGVDGGIDAVRKELYRPMNADQLPDFVLPLKVVEQGFRVVYEPEAILKEPSLNNTEDEYRMRVRVSLRALWAISDMRALLSIKKYKMFAWQLWSHKLLRYLCFIFMIMAFLSNLLLWSTGWFYNLAFIIQLLAYLGALLSPIFNKRGHNLRLLYLLNYFMLLNLASAHAFIKFIFRRKQVTWTPRTG